MQRSIRTTGQSTRSDNMDPEPVDDKQNCIHEQSFFEEAAELSGLVQRVVEDDGNSSQQLYNRFKAILYKYQEQSHLLDAHLEGIVVPLASLLRQQAVQQHGLQRVLGTCRLLNVLVVVRGYKTVVRFFPHEAADLERVVDLLRAVRGETPKDNDEGIAIWEAQTMLLLWLSILILIPFDLATVDSSAVGDASAGREDALYTPLVGRILHMCKDYLHHPGGVREMSCVVLGRLLTRPDMGPAFRAFLEWCPGAVASVEPLRQPFLLPGIMQALCCAFKMGQRERLLPFASTTWALAYQLANPSATSTTSSAEQHVLARKLSVKLFTRIGLTFLPRSGSLAPWRYVRDGAALDTTLALTSGKTEAATAAAAAAGAGADDDSGENPGQQQHDAEEEGEEEDGDIELVAEIEEVVDVLLRALRDRDTVVRWSGAKGLGRVAGGLPRELGEELVEGVMQLFGPTEPDSSWHGGCLALAELARRGLLLPARLPALLPLLTAALTYDVRRGPHSIGAHVRDAGAYVCWAFARAYAPELLSGCVTQLASCLLTVACYDREVNCRRAAAASFQEAVGRLGNFPYGIPLLTIADYFSVGITQQAYLRVAPAVAALGSEYRLPLATHLVRVKSRHWDMGLRELAARGAAALADHVGDYLGGQALDELLQACLDEQLEIRHGAVVMVAELLPALSAAASAAPRSPSEAATTDLACGAQQAPPGPSRSPAGPPRCWPLSPERLAAVAGLVPAIDKARLYRGRGGEMMRQAVGRLVEGCAEVRLELSAAQHGKVLEALDENLRHPQQYIQTGAVAALKAYARAYLSSDTRAAASFRSRFQDAYLTRMHDPNVAVRRGYSLALGSLPYSLLASVLEESVEALVDGCVPEDDPDQRDVESRVNCTRALGLLIDTAFGGLGSRGGAGTGESATAVAGPPDAAQRAVELLRDKILPCLRTSLEDYTTDNRGDVGSWVRETAMGVLAGAVGRLEACYRAAGMVVKGGGGERSVEVRQELTGIAGNAVGLLLRQSVERISRLREAALRHTRTLLGNMDVLPYIPAAAAVSAAVEEASAAADAGGAAASLEALQRVVLRLLHLAPYTEPLLEGLVASVGGVDNSLAKAASQALLEAVTAAPQSGVVADTPPASFTAETSTSECTSSGKAVLLTAVGGHLSDIWTRHRKCPRLATPLLRTAMLLVTKTPSIAAVLLPRPPPPQAASAAACTASGYTTEASSCSTSRFLDHLVEAVRSETRGCSDVARLLDAGSLLCHLVPYTGHCRTSALQGLMVLLCSRYPKVRRHAAEQLYLQLLALDTPAATSEPSRPDTAASPSLEEQAEAACDLLLMTSWDGELEAARGARDQLAELLGVEVPKMKAPGGAAAGRGEAGSAAARDENASYQALLDDFARGY